MADPPSKQDCKPTANGATRIIEWHFVAASNYLSVDLPARQAIRPITHRLDIHHSEDLLIFKQPFMFTKTKICYACAGDALVNVCVGTVQELHILKPTKRWKSMFDLN